MYIRSALVTLSVILLTIVSLTQSFLLNEKVACIEDKLFDWTEAINEYFAENAQAKNTFLIVCGLFMDIMVLTQFIRFAFYGKSWRFPLAMLAFYFFRAML